MANILRVGQRRKVLWNIDLFKCKRLVFRKQSITDDEENTRERKILIGFRRGKIYEQVFRGKERYRKGERLCQRAIKQERV